MKTVAVLFGGKSSEYEVSLSSAYGALTNINTEKYNIVKLGITREGQFWYYCDSIEKIADGTWTDGEKYPVCEYFVSGDKIQVVDIPVGCTHNIENLGDTDMVTFMWCNECFDPSKPDTYFEEV